MKAKVTTTITSLVDLDTFAVEHATDIDATDLPVSSVAKAVAVGACRATLASLGHPVPDEDAAIPSDAGERGE